MKHEISAKLHDLLNNGKINEAYEFIKCEYNKDKFNIDLKINFGLLSIDTEKYAKGIEILTEILPFVQVKDGFYFKRGYAYFKVNDIENALKDLDLAITFNPTAEAFNNRGNIFQEMKMFDHAIIDLEKSISLKPTLAIASINLSQIYGENLKLYEKAISVCENYLKIDPSNPDILVHLGSIYKEKGIFDKALYYYDKAVNLNISNPNCINLRGSIYATIEKFQNALNDFDKALEINPNYFYARINRGMLKEKLGDFEGAYNDFKYARLKNKITKYEYFELRCFTQLEDKQLSKNILNDSFLKQLEYEGSQLTHYTSIEVLEEIIFNSSKLRLSNINQLNDKIEGNVINKITGINESLEYKPIFTASFTENQDSTLMWMLYGRGGIGCSITFNSKLFEADKMASMFNIIYYNFNKNQFIVNGEISPILNNKELNEITKIDLLHYLVKSDEWRHENEIRIIKIANDDKEIKKNNSSLNSRQYIELDSNLINHIEIITLGPRVNNPEGIKKLLVDKLNQIGAQNIKILISKSNLK